MNETESLVPEGFVPIPHQSRFSRHLGTIFMPEGTTDDSVAAENLVIIGFLLKEPHTGGPGRGHGGVTMTLLDEAMGRAASIAVDAMCVTISMTTNFCQSTRIGDFIQMQARVIRQGKNIVFVDGELLDSRGKLVASATGTWNNTGIPIPGRDNNDPG